MSIERGDKVYLTFKFAPCSSYPVAGSELECVGIVVNTSVDKALVNWEDGTNRVFNKKHLTKAIDMVPPKCKSIW